MDHFSNHNKNDNEIPAKKSFRLKHGFTASHAFFDIRFICNHNSATLEREINPVVNWPHSILTCTINSANVIEPIKRHYSGHTTVLYTTIHNTHQTNFRPKRLIKLN